MERLQKILARAGIASRRKCEDLITAGRVTIDGQVVRELGTKADLAQNDIRCDGQPVRPERFVYYLVSKPRGMECTHGQPGSDRPSVFELFTGVSQRLFAVGRLDVDSEGLLIVTNDGGFANRIAHPRYGVSKTYEVTLDALPTDEQIAELKSGVYLSDGKVRFAEIGVRRLGRDRAVARVVLRQGLNREIRRAFAALGLKVRRLRRVAIGGLTDSRLRPGHRRKLSQQEIGQLRGNTGRKST
jgi:23S rRNA pseudouridine2605 synthase